MYSPRSGELQDQSVRSHLLPIETIGYLSLYRKWYCGLVAFLMLPARNGTSSGHIWLLYLGWVEPYMLYIWKELALVSFRKSYHSSHGRINMIYGNTYSGWWFGGVFLVESSFLFIHNGHILLCQKQRSGEGMFKS